jgi:stage III sporulation protein AG
MEKGIWQRLSGLLKDGGEKKGARPMYFYLALLLVGIVLMFISANPERESEPTPPSQSTEVISPSLGRADYREQLERDMENRLGKVKGVSEVTVLITLEGGPVYEYAQNSDSTDRNTREEAGDGGTRNISESTKSTQAVIARENNGERAVITRELLPQIKGVLVVARGADNPLVKEQIAHAVAAAFNLPAHRISVLPMK